MKIGSGGSRRGVLLTLAVLLLSSLAASTTVGAVPPPGMHYELVSPANVGGTLAVGGGQSMDGNRIQVLTPAGQGFGNTPSYNIGGNYFVAERTPQGWVTKSLNAPAAPGIAVTSGLDLASDLSAALTRSSTTAQYHSSQSQLQRVSLDGVAHPTLPVLTDLTGKSQDLFGDGYVVYSYAGSSADVTHAVFKVLYANRLLPTDSPAADVTQFRIYEVAGAGTDTAVLRRVDVDDGGAEMGPKCGAEIGGARRVGGDYKNPAEANAVSADGSKIFFSGRPGADATCNVSAFPIRVFARVNGEHTIPISASECTRGDCSTSVGDAWYQAASPSGQRVAFVSSEQLTNSDTDSTPDLYLYDFAGAPGNHLKQLSIGGGTGDATPGAGAAVQGLVKMSDDGSRVYFTATGVLTTEPNTFGQAATLGGRNLYLYEPGTNKTSFIATVNASDKLDLTDPADNISQFAGLSDASGGALVFTTAVALAPSDTDSAQDVYRYKATGWELAKLSPGNGPEDAKIPIQRQSGKTTPGQRAISGDGRRAVFTTTEQLAPEDTNGKNDVYLSVDGDIRLVSGGQGADGAASMASISVAGDQVTFATSERLLPKEDVDDVQSVYVAREGADIDRPTIDKPICDGDHCQGPLGPLPEVSPSGAPADGGLGNLPVVDPSYRVPKLTASQRSQLAKNGSAKLAVTVSEAGQVVASATGLINKGTSTVASGKATAAKGGVVNVTLKLTSAARRQLTSAGRLTAKLNVTFSKVAPVQTQTVKLTKAKPKVKKKTKNSSNKRSSKKVSSKSVKRDSGR